MGSGTSATVDYLSLFGFNTCDNTGKPNVSCSEQSASGCTGSAQGDISGEYSLAPFGFDPRSSDMAQQSGTTAAEGVQGGSGLPESPSVPTPPSGSVRERGSVPAAKKRFLAEAWETGQRMKRREGSAGNDLESLIELPDCCVSDWGGSSEEEKEELSEGEEVEEQYFSVAADPELCPPSWETASLEDRVEDDTIQRRCKMLRRKLRKRPCLPLSTSGSGEMSPHEIASGVRLPLYSCPFEGCAFNTADRALFLHHVAGGVSDTTHLKTLREICGGCTDIPGVTMLEYVHGAVAIAERERWPMLGLSVTRRSLNLLCLRYNDTQMKCLCCFVCGQLRTTVKGYSAANLQKPSSEAGGVSSEIEFRRIVDLTHLELDHPGVLLNNTSYSLWKKRYVDPKQFDGKMNPLQHASPSCVPWSSLVSTERAQHISRWALDMALMGKSVTMFGCTEHVVGCSHRRSWMVRLLSAFLPRHLTTRHKTRRFS